MLACGPVTAEPFRDPYGFGSLFPDLRRFTALVGSNGVIYTRGVAGGVRLALSPPVVQAAHGAIHVEENNALGK